MFVDPPHLSLNSPKKGSFGNLAPHLYSFALEPSPKHQESLSSSQDYSFNSSIKRFSIKRDISIKTHNLEAHF